MQVRSIKEAHILAKNLNACRVVSQVHPHLCLFIITIMISLTTNQSTDELASEPKVSDNEKSDQASGDLINADDSVSSTAKPDTTRKSNYSDPRFASLFSKSRRQNPSRLSPKPKHTTRVKPTLPSFIRNAPTNRVTTESTTTKSSRIIKTTPKPKPKSPSRVTTSSSSRSSNNNNNSNNRNNRLRDSVNAVTTESPKKNRRFGDSSYSPRNSTRTRSSGRN